MECAALNLKNSSRKSQTKSRTHAPRLLYDSTDYLIELRSVPSAAEIRTVVVAWDFAFLSHKHYCYAQHSIRSSRWWGSWGSSFLPFAVAHAKLSLFFSHRLLACTIATECAALARPAVVVVALTPKLMRFTFAVVVVLSLFGGHSLVKFAFRDNLLVKIRWNATR